MEHEQDREKQRVVQYLRNVHPGQRIHRNMMEKYLPHHSSRLLTLLEDDEQIQELVCPLVDIYSPSERSHDRYTFPLLRRRFSMSERTCAVVDLNNLSWTIRPETIPNLLEDLYEWGVTRQHIVADANIHERLSTDLLQFLAHAPYAVEVTIAPTGVPADRIILEHVRQEESFVVSNDTFRDWRKTFPDLRRSLWRRRVPVTRTREEESVHGYTLGDAGIELANAPKKHIGT